MQSQSDARSPDPIQIHESGRINSNGKSYPPLDDPFQSFKIARPASRGYRDVSVSDGRSTDTIPSLESLVTGKSPAQTPSQDVVQAQQTRAGETERQRIRTRGLTACQACRSRKTKCDSLRPKCSYCQKTDAKCSYIEDEIYPHSYVNPNRLVVLALISEAVIHLVLRF
jgi:hypothetical protein